MIYHVVCPVCSHTAYQYGCGCHNCGAKVGWPDAPPSPDQDEYFAKHGLQWIGGSVLAAVVPAAKFVKDGRSFFMTDVDVPAVLSGAINSGSGAINISHHGSGASRANVVFDCSTPIGYVVESGRSRAQYGVRLACFDRPGQLHPYPDDVPGPFDTLISGSSF